MSFLSIIGGTINITNNDLNVNTLYLSSSDFGGTSKSIRTTNLLVNMDSQKSIMNNILEINERDLISVDQYGYVIDQSCHNLKESYNDNDYINKDFRIKF